MDKRENKKSISKTVLSATVFFFIVALCLLFFAVSSDKKDAKSESENEPYDYYQEENEDRVRYDGKWYRVNENVTNYLIIGVDKYSDELDDVVYHRNNERCDFVLLISVNDENKKITPILLNRDSMVDVNMIGIDGGSYDEETMQLALSYTYGTGNLDSCLNTAKAVSKMFYGIPVKKYYAVTMDAVKVINDAVGGVPVYIDDDSLIDADPSFIYGSTVTLKGDSALNFVRARMGVSTGLNTERMSRQKTYLKSLKEKLVPHFSDTSFVISLLDDIEEYSVTNIPAEEVISLSEKTEKYEIAETISLEGENVLGEKYMEFYVDNDSMTKLAVETFFTLSEE